MDLMLVHIIWILKGLSWPTHFSAPASIDKCYRAAEFVWLSTTSHGCCVCHRVLVFIDWFSCLLHTNILPVAVVRVLHLLVCGRFPWSYEFAVNFATWYNFHPSHRRHFVTIALPNNIFWLYPANCRPVTLTPPVSSAMERLIRAKPINRLLN